MTTRRTTVRCQLIVPSTNTLAITAAPGGIVLHVSEFSISQAAFAAAVIRPARAPGKRPTK